MDGPLFHHQVVEQIYFLLTRARQSLGAYRSRRCAGAGRVKAHPRLQALVYDSAGKRCSECELLQIPSTGSRQCRKAMLGVKAHPKLHAPIYDSAGKRCSECALTPNSKHWFTTVPESDARSESSPQTPSTGLRQCRKAMLGV